MGVGLFFAACTDNEPLLYDAGQKDAVYFQANKETDSLYYNFGLRTIESHQIKIPVYLMGLPRSQDREIQIELENDKYADPQAGVIPAEEGYYNLPQSIVLKADSVMTHIPVTLLRHQDLRQNRAVVTIHLVEGVDFDVRGYSEYTLVFDDLAPPTPPWWDVWTYGQFSRMKGELFFEFFREMQQESPVLYDQIVDRWGEFLEIEPNTFGDNPLYTYRIAFGLHVHTKMYHYFQEHPELGITDIQKPNY